MIRFPGVQDPPEGSPLAELYARARELGFESNGVVVNFLRSQSARPDLMSVCLDMMHTVVSQGQLPPTVKQMIATAVALQNKCNYCSVTHLRVMEMMGVSPEILGDFSSDLRFDKLPPVQRAIVLFALKIAENPRSLTDEDFNSLRDHGLSEGEIIEVVVMTCFAQFTNAWADISKITVDGEAAD